jgi:hypothetical protein
MTCLRTTAHEETESLTCFKFRFVSSPLTEIRGKQGKLAIKPKSRHAELVVNLAGIMASFLVSTWDEHQRNC